MPGTQHKALFLESAQGRFVIGDNETPKPGPGQVLVRVEAAGLNPLDWREQKQPVYIKAYPAIFGYDNAGIVEEVGEGVIKFVKGDRIFYEGRSTPLKAAFQQYNLTDVEFAAKIPDNLTFEQAASIPAGLFTAVVGFYSDRSHNGAGLSLPKVIDPSSSNPHSGKPLVILGGSSCVGQYAIQFARLSGFSPIIVTASLRNEDLLKSLGATHIVDRRLTPTLSEEVSKITTAPVETIYDAIGVAETQDAGYNLLASGGHMVTVLPLTKEYPNSDKQISFFFGVFTLPHTREIGLKVINKITDLLADRSVKPNKVEVLPGGLNGIAGGLARMAADEISGLKLVARPHETD